MEGHPNLVELGWMAYHLHGIIPINDIGYPKKLLYTHCIPVQPIHITYWWYIPWYPIYPIELYVYIYIYILISQPHPMDHWQPQFPSARRLVLTELNRCVQDVLRTTRVEMQQLPRPGPGRSRDSQGRERGGAGFGMEINRSIKVCVHVYVYIYIYAMEWNGMEWNAM